MGYFVGVTTSYTYSNQFMRHGVTVDYHDSSLEACPQQINQTDTLLTMGNNNNNNTFLLGAEPQVQVQMQKIPLPRQLSIPW